MGEEDTLGVPVETKLGYVGGSKVGEQDSHVAAPHRTALHEVISHDFGVVYVYGETDALSEAKYGGVDSDDLPLCAHEGAPAVAHVDGGVGLDEVHERGSALAAYGAVKSADDPLADGGVARESEGVSDGYDVLAYEEGGGVSEQGGMQSVRRYLDDGDVGVAVESDDPGVEGLAVVVALR